MNRRQLRYRVPGGATLLLLLAVFIAGCGSNAGTQTGASGTATSCPTFQFRAVRGTLKSVSNNTLFITDTQGKSVQATYTSSTRFVQQVIVKASTLQEGTAVTAAFTQDTNNNYIATRISSGQVRFPGTGSGTPVTGRGTAGVTVNGTPCARTGRAGNGGTGTTGSTAHTLAGTISQVSATSITIADFNGTDYTLQLNTATQIIDTKTITASALQVGTQLAVTSVGGAQNSKGPLTAQLVTILLPGQGQGVNG